MMNKRIWIVLAILSLIGFIITFAYGILIFQSNNGIKQDCNNYADLSDKYLGKLLIIGTPYMSDNYTIINDDDFTEFSGHKLKVISYKDNMRTSVNELQVDSKIEELRGSLIEIDGITYIVDVFEYGSKNIIYSKIGTIDGYSFQYDTMFMSSNHLKDFEEHCDISIGYRIYGRAFNIYFKSRTEHEGCPYFNSKYIYDGYVKLGYTCPEISEHFLNHIPSECFTEDCMTRYLQGDIFLDFYEGKCNIVFGRGKKHSYTVSIDFSTTNEHNSNILINFQLQRQ